MSVSYTHLDVYKRQVEHLLVVGVVQVGQEAVSYTHLDVYKRQVSAIIAGPRASPDTRKSLQECAARFGSRYFDIRIGKTSAVPYFVDAAGSTYTFIEGEIVAAPQSCEACGEPLTEESDLCSWCCIEDSHRDEAASRNPYRMFHHFGMLESYIKDMEAIRTGSGKK